MAYAKLWLCFLWSVIEVRNDEVRTKEEGGKEM
jgi:hypothetical protein